MQVRNNLQYGGRRFSLRAFLEAWRNDNYPHYNILGDSLSIKKYYVYSTRHTKLSYCFVLGPILTGNVIWKLFDFEKKTWLCPIGEQRMNCQSKQNSE